MSGFGVSRKHQEIFGLEFWDFLGWKKLGNFFEILFWNDLRKESEKKLEVLFWWILDFLSLEVQVGH